MPGDPAAPPQPNRSGRETRLLLVTIAVSVAMLLLLARFRFPAESRPDAPTAPLERLAARATYDELANIIAQLESRLSSLLLVIHLSPIDRGTARLGPIGAPAVVSRSGESRFVPAIRLRRDAAIAFVPAGWHVTGVGPLKTPPELVRVDPVRELAMVRVSAAADPAWRPERADALRTPTYVALVEGGPDGPTIEPRFLSRTIPATDPRWERPLVELGGVTPLEAGSLVFSLDGRFVGLGAGGGEPRLIPAELLDEVAARLSEEDQAWGYLGVQVEPLTPGLSSATGAEHGAVVSFVDPRGPGAKKLRVGDAIEAVAGEPVFSPEEFNARIIGTRPGTGVALRVKRDGQEQEVAVEIAVRPDPATNGKDGDLGLTLRGVAGVGSEVVRVGPGSSADRAGFMPGDLITQLNGRTAPTPAQIVRAFGSAKPGAILIVGLERESRPRVLALERP